MPHSVIRRTWPCGMQESIDVKGWAVSSGEDEKPRPCPQHGTGPCYRGVGGA